MTINAILVCGKCGRPTLHVFVDRRPQHRAKDEVAFVDLYYECYRCGTPRVWGSEPRLANARGQWLGDAAFAHAVDHHGMRRRSCGACRGLGLDCAECDGDGHSWTFAQPEPCGPACPLGRRPEEGNG